MLLIEWTASAKLDLLEILDYIAERNEKAADRLFERIEQDLEHAAEHPYLFKSSGNDYLAVIGDRLDNLVNLMNCCWMEV